MVWTQDLHCHVIDTYLEDDSKLDFADETLV